MSVSSVARHVKVCWCNAFVHWWTMARGTRGLGLLPSFSFLHSLIHTQDWASKAKPAPRNRRQQPTEHRASVNPMWPHTEPGTFYTIQPGMLTKPLEITSVHVGHPPVVAVPKRRHRYQRQIHSRLTAHNSALFQSEKQRQAMHPRPQGGGMGIWIQMCRPDTD